jgi:hypothetical protein
MRRGGDSMRRGRGDSMRRGGEGSQCEEMWGEGEKGGDREGDREGRGAEKEGGQIHMYK